MKAEMRRTGKSLKSTVNELLRLGLTRSRYDAPPEPFRVVARDLGASKPGLQLDDIAELLEHTEGPFHR